MDAKKIRESVDNLFSKRTSLHALWQEQAENFYPERADFTVKRYLGTDFAANLTTSYPVLCCRDLKDQLSSMLRPTAKSWFHMKPQDPDREDNEAKRWLERAETIMRRAMYDRIARFTRATKEGDADFAAFGQCVISVEVNWGSKHGPHLLYRTWHLRDVVWQEGADGDIALVGRKWKPTVRDLTLLFGSGKLHAQINAKLARQPFEEVQCYHIVCDADMYDDKAGGKPRWSIYYDADHDCIIEATPIWGRHYRIPRWQTVSGSQYAFSPATVAALPEARLLQAMAYTLLEAGEKVTNPPLIATMDAVRSDMAVYAGGVTWIDNEYDERTGEALRPMPIDSKGFPIGIDMQRDSRSLLMQAFFLNKLNLPQRAPEMTAYEIGQRIQEYIRGAMPIFEPMEMEYNGGICDETFDLLQRAASFGSPFDMPESLRGADIEFHFESPLHDAIEQQKGQKWLEAKTIIADATAVDKRAVYMLDAVTAMRDVMSGIGIPAKWVPSEAEFERITRQAAQKDQQAATLAQMEQGSQVAANLSTAKKNLADAAAVGA